MTAELFTAQALYWFFRRKARIVVLTFAIYAALC